MIKKSMGLLILVLSLLVFIGCNGNSITTTEISTTETPSITEAPSTETPTTGTPTTETPTTIEELSLSQTDVEAYKDETITLDFIYNLTNAESAVLETMIVAFETMYPNVDIVPIRRSQSDQVIKDFFNSFYGGVKPELILTDQKYFSILSYHFQSLDYYMNSEATLNGVNVGLSESVLEMNLFSNHSTYEEPISFPFTRMSELIFANRSTLSANASALIGENIDMTNQGFLSRSTGLTLNDLSVISSVIDDRTTLMLRVPNITFETLMGQSNISIYENGEFNIDQSLTNDLMSSLRTFSNEEILHIVSHLSAYDYTDLPFLDESTLFAVADTRALRYMTPGATFDIDILPMIDTGETGSVFYGSDLGINLNSSDAEKFYSWMFIRFVTDFENGYLSFCQDLGFTPIYDSNTYVSNQTYVDFIQIAQDYISSEGNPEWTAEDSRWDKLYLSMIQLAYQTNRQNIYVRSFPSAINSIEVRANEDIINDYMESVFYSSDSIESLTAELITNLTD